MEVGANDVYMLEIVGIQPYVDGLGGKAAVALGHDGYPTCKIVYVVRVSRIVCMYYRDAIYQLSIANNNNNNIITII